MSIVKTSFGKLPCGCEADLYILKNASGASVEITNFGGIIHAINVPDRDGKLGDVVLAQGMKIDDVIARCKGIQCRGGTSCPDQLAHALEEMRKSGKDA